MICIQSIPDPNPGAVTSFIAMEDVPGRVFDWTEFWSRTTVLERAQKRAAFSKAYQYVIILKNSSVHLLICLVTAFNVAIGTLMLDCEISSLMMSMING